MPLEGDAGIAEFSYSVPSVWLPWGFLSQWALYPEKDLFYFLPSLPYRLPFAGLSRIPEQMDQRTNPQATHEGLFPDPHALSCIYNLCLVGI